MALTIEQIGTKVESLIRKAAERDARATRVLVVRQGKINTLYPDLFSESIDENVVANFVDIVARDLSEVMAPLPAVNCSAANQVNDKARKFADTRTRIASNYLLNSDMTAHMYVFADRYVTYGFAAFIVELDKEGGLPRIRVEDSYMSYPEFDRYNRCVSFTKRYVSTLGELISQYPSLESALKGENTANRTTNLDTVMDVYRYYDKDQSTIYVPTRKNLVLSKAKNPIGKMMVVVAKRPSIDDDMRGQFDDVLGIQVLRNRFAMLAVEAAEKSIGAPIVLPMDVRDFQIGSDAIIQTQNPEGVKRIALEVPSAAFTESALLNQEMQTGARYPQGRTGNINASVITGQGVQALMGAFDTQVKSFQAIAGGAIRDVLKICFMVDEKVYNKKKTIRGVDAGSPYSIEYTPDKDINGDYSVDVSYGMLAGLNPAQALVFMLQASQAGWVSDDKSMRELPFNINVTVEQEKIEVEKMRKSLLASVEQMTLSIPQMIAQGQDPSELIHRISQTIVARQKGETIETAMEKIFAPAPPPPEADPNMPSDPNMADPSMQGQPMVEPMGGMEQGGQAPPEDIQTLLSRISGGGQASTSVSTSSR